jgi:ligand-binding sensor domain-containing protein
MAPWTAPCARVLTLCALAWATAAFGQDAAVLRFDHLTVEQGLANSWVVDILKGRRGFMWFATPDGLSRYDGTRVVNYRYNPDDPTSLPSQRVSVLFEDSRGRLWIGMDGPRRQGLALYDRARDAFQPIAVGATAAAPGGRAVLSIAEDRQGVLWFGTDLGVYHAAVPGTPPSTLGDPGAALLSDTPIARVLCDSGGLLWAGTYRGLYRIDPRTTTFQAWQQQGTEVDLLASTRVTALYETPAALWVGSREGLFRIGTTGGVRRYAADARRRDGLATNTVLSVTGDGHERLFVGTENFGLQVLDTRTDRFSRYVADPEDHDSLAGDSIHSLRFDDQGTLWVGTFNAGVDYSSPWAHRFGVLRAGHGGLSGAQVSAVMQDHDGDVWVGTDGDGLNHIDHATGSITRYRHDPLKPNGLASNAILTLFEDSEERVWIGSWAGGVQVLDPRSGRFTSFRHDPRDPTSSAIDSAWVIRAGPDGRLLVSGQNGAIQWLDPRRGKFASVHGRYPKVTAGVIVNAVAWDGNDVLWLGGSDAERLDLETGDVEVLRFEGGERVAAVHVDTRRNVWFGTRKAGLFCRERGTSVLRHYTVDDGLPSNNVVTILEDQSRNLWLGTGRGLVKLEDAVNQPASAHIIVYDLQDGLPGYEFSRGAAFRSPSGEMFFGSTRGLVRFFPEKLGRNPHAPPVVLTGLRILNRLVDARSPNTPLTRTITETTELTLSPADSVATFEFAALNFSLSHKNHYRYRLEGFDRDWIDAGKRGSATYTNLAPGSYRLRVVAANNDDVWNEEGVTLSVVQRPRFYRTKGFVFALGLLALALGLGVHRVRVRDHVRLEAQLQARLAVARSEIRTLSGLLPICTECKKVRDDDGYWGQIEAYVTEHTEADFSHGICPDCRERVFAARPPAEPGSTS